MVTLTNASTAYGYLSNGRLRTSFSIECDRQGSLPANTCPARKRQQTIGFGLVGANQTRRMALPVIFPKSGGRVEAEFTPDA